MKTKPATASEKAAMQPNGSIQECPAKTAATLFKLDNILVPVDFSDYSKKALQYAVPFARQFNARMIFLHVLPFQYAAGWDQNRTNYEAPVEDDSQRITEARLNALIRGVVPNDVPSQVEVRHGSPTIEIMNVAKELDVDLIIMSTHGHTGRVHAFIGSVAGDVTRLAPCPVLVVREHEREFVTNGDNPFKLDANPGPTKGSLQ